MDVATNFEKAESAIITVYFSVMDHCIVRQENIFLMLVSVYNMYNTILIQNKDTYLDIIHVLYKMKKNNGPIFQCMYDVIISLTLHGTLKYPKNQVNF